MSNDVPTLGANKRDALGSRKVSALRDEGRLPAQVYGHAKGNVNLSLNTHEVTNLLRTRPSMIALDIDGESQTVLIKDVQFDTFGQNILHIDFMRVDPDEMVEVSVALDVFGTPKGADDGGRLEILRNIVHMKVRADRIPGEIQLNASPLKVGDTITFSDIPLPEGAELLENPNGLVVSCSLSKRAAAAARGKGGEEAAEEGAEGEAGGDNAEG